MTRKALGFCKLRICHHFVGELHLDTAEQWRQIGDDDVNRDLPASTASILSNKDADGTATPRDCTLGGEERGGSGRPLESSRRGQSAIHLVIEVIHRDGSSVWCMLDVERRLVAQMKTCRGWTPIYSPRANQYSHDVASSHT
jgi:hypothetical protein